MAEEEFVDDKSLDEALNESIGATLKEIQSRPDDEPEEVKAERDRDEHGKFTKVEKVEKDAAPKAPAAPVETEQPLVTTTGKPIDINRPPGSWKPAAKAQWAGLPEPIRQEIYRRESDFMNSNKGIMENADFGRLMKQTVEPYRMLIEAEGGTPEKAVADLMRTAALFRVGTPQQKTQAVQQLIKQFNVQMPQEQPVADGQPPQAQEFKDPRVDSLLENMQAQERRRANEEERASNQATEQFVSAKDDKGQPKYPFIDNVLNEMLLEVEYLRRTNPALPKLQALEQAYEKAVWANPETRQVLLDQKQAAASQPVENLRKVEQAKRASAVNVPKRGALPATGPVQSLDDSIRETGRALGMF